MGDLNTAGPLLVPMPAYVVEPPDVLRLEVAGLRKSLPSVGEDYPVRPDGTVSLGEYGGVSVAGLTIEQARDAVVKHLKPFAKKRATLDVEVSVAAFTSKAYYVIAEVGGGEQVMRIACTGSEQVLPVDWKGITQEGLMATNYQIFPGDRLYVTAPPTAQQSAWWQRPLGIGKPK